MNWKNDPVFESEGATKRPNQSEDHTKILRSELKHVQEELEGTKSQSSALK